MSQVEGDPHSGFPVLIGAEAFVRKPTFSAESGHIRPAHLFPSFASTLYLNFIDFHVLPPGKSYAIQGEIREVFPLRQKRTGDRACASLRNAVSRNQCYVFHHG